MPPLHHFTLYDLVGIGVCGLFAVAALITLAEFMAGWRDGNDGK
jgi:hypothetical protein